MSADKGWLLEQARAAGWAMEPVARRFLADNGVPCARFAWARTADEALAAAGEIGYPVVVKVVSPQVVHKTDVGGVEVGIRDDRGLTEAFERMSALPGFDGVVVDEMVRGVELIVGAKEDPQFGTVVLVGIGGTSVEVYKDVAIRMAPVSADEARVALSRLEGRALLHGHRGGPAADVGALARLIEAFSAVAHDLSDVAESIDLNPVIATPERAVVADARIMLRGHS